MSTKITVRKVGDKAEVTETVTTIKENVTMRTLAEVQQDLADAQTSRSNLIDGHVAALIFHDFLVIEKQKAVDDAIALGIT